nr:MAG TPA: hypothetical protein [Caudoviricetes sp.]
MHPQCAGCAARRTGNEKQGNALEKKSKASHRK